MVMIFSSYFIKKTIAMPFHIQQNHFYQITQYGNILLTLCMLGKNFIRQYFEIF